MTEFEKTYQNYNPRQAALDEARALLTAAAKAAMADGALPEAELPAFIVEIPADVKNGDIASNIAMAGARSWRKAPRMIADALLAHLPAMENSVFAKVEVAGPGFINLFLSQSFWAGVVLGACANREYGRTNYGKGAKYNVEFVSANPTGPMHMGNARGGALGDCLAAGLVRLRCDPRVLYQRCRQPDPEVRQEPCSALSAEVLRRGDLPSARRVLSGRRHQGAGR